LATGTFPDRLKFSEVKSLFKKGDKADFTNYRPISLLTSLSKIIEKIIYRRLYKHLLINNVLVKEQFGFREKSSTDMATQAFLNTILLFLDKKEYVGGLFCDLQKDFDCVNHDTLLAKLDYYGITGTANKLMSSYLKNRHQRVVLKDSMLRKSTSKWEPVNTVSPRARYWVHCSS
jgi:hypothetical protein